MKIENNQMLPDDGKAIKRKSDKTYCLGSTLLKGESEKDFDEIDLEEAKRINKQVEEDELREQGIYPAILN